MQNIVKSYIRYSNRLEHINNAALKNPINLIKGVEDTFNESIDSVAKFLSKNHTRYKMMMISGPSCSGKTTTSLKLQESLQGYGIQSQIISLDNFYLGRGQAPMLPNGEQDYESINALNLPVLNKCLDELVNKGECEIPIFDFNIGSPSDRKMNVSVGKDKIVIFEGIHALNPLIVSTLPDEQLVKMYISVKQGIKDNEKEIITARDIRLIRRLVRDSKFRNSSAENTFTMWAQVCRGEDMYIQPFKRTADFTINTLHIYEPCVMEQYVLPVLAQLKEDSKFYNHAQELIKKVRRFEDIKPDLIPINSLMREFIGEGKYEY